MQVGNIIAYGKNNADDVIIVQKKQVYNNFAPEDKDVIETIEFKKGPLFLSSKSVERTNSWSEVEQLIYKKMQNREEQINIIYTGDTNFGVWDRLGKCIDKIYEHDHYLYYNTIVYSYSMGYGWDEIEIEVDIEYRTTKAEEDYVNNRVRQALSRIIKPGMSDRAKVKAIHDYIISNVTYDYSYSRYTAYNALYDGKAVCQGYSLLGYKMLNEAGIPTRIIASLGMDHSWNLVKLSGKWYHLDITWNDNASERVGGKTMYTYFLLTDKEIKKDHFWASEEYPTAGEGIIFADSQ